MYPNFKIAKNLAKPFFSSSKQANFPPKITSLTKNGLQECRIFNKMRIVVGDNSPVIFTIFICLIKPFLKSNTSLNPTRIFHQKRRLTWRHQPFFDPYSFLVSGTFSRGKSSSFWTAKISETFWETHFFKFRIVNPFTARVSDGVL